MANRRSRAAQVPAKVAQRVKERDRMECIFCTAGYHIREAPLYERRILDIMHYVPRSRGGMGIEENLAVGCRFHHAQMDNGNKGWREEMLGIFREYLKDRYPGWKEEYLVYRKGGAYGEDDG